MTRFTCASAREQLREGHGHFTASFRAGDLSGMKTRRPATRIPRGGFETCGIVELMHSFEMLTKIPGSPFGRIVARRSRSTIFPAALTPDEKALHYITCANQVQLDRENKSPAMDNSGTMVSYSPYEVYRCCQHNVSHGWPVLRGGTLAGHAGQRPLRFALRRLRSNAKPGNGPDGRDQRRNRLSVSGHSQVYLKIRQARPFPALFAGAALVRGRHGPGQWRNGAGAGARAGFCSFRAGMAGWRYCYVAPADEAGGAEMA